jgi:enterochelin esterase-like enzyme
VRKFSLRSAHVYWLLAIFLAFLLHYGWTQLTRTRGVQLVSFVAAEQACGTAGRLRYCAYQAKAGSNGDIVYHLHARNMDEQSWNDDSYLTAMLQAEWQRSGALPPTVVSLSYGGTWILSPKGQTPDSGLLDDLMARVPEIEAKLGRPRRRLLLGESMGGLNVLVAGLSYPARFQKVAALCPGVYATSPFAPLSTIRASMERTGANPKTALAIWLMGRKYVANEAEWSRISPLSLIGKANSRYPALYLSNGLYDKFGNFEGTQALAETARRRGVSTEWRPLYGGHCATDISSLASFLVS